MSEPAPTPERHTKVVLIVDDDPGTLHVLSHGLGRLLGEFEVITAEDGRAAIDVLESRDIDVLVTDLAMPVMDGFALLAYVTNRKQALPVVVFSALAAEDIAERLAPYEGLRVLRKPVSYRDLATCLHEVLDQAAHGAIEGIPLAGVVQLIESERRTCTVVVSSGRRRGRLYFESGRLINAFSDDFGSEGEAAAYDILGWSGTVITFEPLPDEVRRLVHTPMRLMLLEVAVVQDALREQAERAIPPVPQSLLSRVVPTNDAGRNDTSTALVGAASDDTTSDEPDDRPNDDPDDDMPQDQPSHLDQAEEGHHMADDHDRFDHEAERQQGREPDEREPSGATDAGEGAAAAPEAADLEATPEPQPGAADDLWAPADAVREIAAEPHVADLVAAMARLGATVHSAEQALASVAAEVAAFEEAQRRFEAATAERERRRLELEAFRDDVAGLAREILGRVERMFESSTPGADGATPHPEARADGPGEAGSS